MRKRLNKFPVKILYYAVFLLIVYVLQTALFSRIPVFGVKPMIFPLVAVCAAMFEGSLKGGLLGLAAGMLCDISYHQPCVQFTLLLAITALFVGVLSDTVLAKGFPTYLIVGIASLFICTFAQVAGFLIHHGIAIPYILKPALIQVAYSAVFLIPVYFCVRRISRFSASY